MADDEGEDINKNSGYIWTDAAMINENEMILNQLSDVPSTATVFTDGGCRTKRTIMETTNTIQLTPIDVDTKKSSTLGRGLVFPAISPTGVAAVGIISGEGKSSSDDFPPAKIIRVDTRSSSLVDAIWTPLDFLHDLEKDTRIDPDYLSTVQREINAGRRRVMLDWIIDVCYINKEQEKVIHMAMSIVDRYMSIKFVPVTQSALVAIAAVWIASKYESGWQALTIKQLRDNIHNSYSKLQIEQMEFEILTTIEFRLMVPNTYTFLLMKQSPCTGTAPRSQRNLARRCLYEYKMLKFLPSKIAQAIVDITARDDLDREIDEEKEKEMENCECVREIMSFL